METKWWDVVPYEEALKTATGWQYVTLASKRFRRFYNKRIIIPHNELILRLDPKHPLVPLVSED